MTATTEIVPRVVQYDSSRPFKRPLVVEVLGMPGVSLWNIEHRWRIYRSIAGTLIADGTTYDSIEQAWKVLENELSDRA
jgi:hypothetical protein